MSAKQLADLLLSSQGDSGFNPLAALSPTAGVPTPPQPAAAGSSQMIAAMLKQQMQENQSTQDRFSNDGRRGTGGLLAGVLNNLAAAQARKTGKEKISDLYQQYFDAQNRETAAERQRQAQAAAAERQAGLEDYAFKQSIESGYQMQRDAAKAAQKADADAAKRQQVADILAGGITGESITRLAAVDPQLATALATVESTRARTQIAQDKAQAEKAERAVIEEKATDESRRALDSVRSLLGNREGLAAATGPISSFFPSFREAPVEFEAEIQNLASLLTVGNLDRMTGVLSESDIKLLRDAASGNLDLRQNEARLYDTLVKAESALAGGLGVDPKFAGTTWNQSGEVDSETEALVNKYTTGY